MAHEEHQEEAAPSRIDMIDMEAAALKRAARVLLDARMPGAAVALLATELPMPKALHGVSPSRRHMSRPGRAAVIAWATDAKERGIASAHFAGTLGWTAALAALLVLVLGMVWQRRLTLLETHGGLGGVLHEIRCDSGVQGIDVSLTHEHFPSSITLRCLGETRSSVVGTETKLLNSMICPEQARGIAGHASVFVDSVVPLCEAADRRWSIGRSRSPKFSETCPADTQFTGLNVRAGGLVDSVELICTRN